MFNVSQTITKITLVNGTYEIVTAGVQGPPGTGSRVKAVEPIGTIDGVNAQFILPEPFINVLDIQLNGIGGEAFSIIDEVTIELLEVPHLGDTLKILYVY